MGYLEELLGAAQGWSGAASATPQDKTDASVRHDAFDNIVYDELVEEVPAFQEMHRDLDYNYAYTKPLPRDVLQLFWQADPLLRERGEMQTEFLRNHAVANDLVESQETEQVRQFTKHDRYAAAMATIAIQEKVKELIEKHSQAQDEDDAFEQAVAAAMAASDAFNQAMAGLAAAMSEVESLMEQFEGEGPMTEEQNAAAEALAEALAQAQEAREAMDETRKAAEREAEKQGRLMKMPLRNALNDVADDLADQSAQFSSWGLDPGQLERMDWRTRAALAQRMDRDKLKEMRDRVGAMRFAYAAESVRKTVWGRDEVIGLELTGEPERFIPAEWAFSGHPALQMDFLQRVADAEVLSSKYIGYERVGKGSIVCLTDSSGSMAGAPNTFCKAFALAMLDAARDGQRDFVGIDFATEREIIQYDFPKGVGPIDRVLDLAEHFWNGGGTNFMAPLDRALKIIEDQFTEGGLAQADILLVTDGLAGVTVEWMKKFQALKKKANFKVWGIMCGAGVPDVMKALCDDTRSVVDFINPDVVTDIFRAI